MFRTFVFYEVQSNNYSALYLYSSKSIRYSEFEVQLTLLMPRNNAPPIMFAKTVTGA